MKKIEVCVPVELVEPLRDELAAAGILAPMGVTLSCGLFRVNEVGPFEPNPRKSRGTTHRKIEVVVSDRLAPRAVNLISDLLAARKGDARLSHLVVLDVEGTYQFEPASEVPPVNLQPWNGVRRKKG